MTNEPQPATSPIKLGDVIYLRSGGPAMTVDRVEQLGVHAETFVTVTWFDGAVLKRTELRAQVLTHTAPLVANPQ